MRVVAGPGTGKSYGLKRRVQRLLEEGCDPKTILAVTFTNVAANALKTDLQAELSEEGIESAKEIKACTLHSLCFGILQKEQVFRLTGRTPRPLMDFEKNFVIEDLKDSFGGKEAVAQLIIDYESAFAREQTDTPGAIPTARDLQFQEKLRSWLTLHNAMLIGEVIPLTIEYLKNHPEAPERTQFEHILVDEYQDLNKAEQVLIHLLVSNSTQFVIVGDEDQSIYRFRNARPEGIAEFGNAHEAIEDVNLTTCRRCPRKVVELVNELMRYPLEQTHKVLVQHESNEDGTIEVVRWSTYEDEIKGIAKFITYLHNVESAALEDILVLAPRSQIGYDLKNELRNNCSIACHTFFKEDFLKEDEAKRRFAMLNYAVNPEDRVALRVLLGMPTPLHKTYSKICEKCVELSKSPREVLQAVQNRELDIPRSNNLIERFVSIEAEAETLRAKSAEEIVQWLIHDLDESSPFRELCSLVDFTEMEDTAQILGELKMRILFPEVSEDDGYVRIMSLHKSKGLSAPYVVIMGCCDGFIPTIKGEDKLREQNDLQEIEARKKEAKRLFFVAATRVKRHLVFSSFNTIFASLAMNMGGLKYRRQVFDLQTRKNIWHSQACGFFTDMVSNLPDTMNGSDFLSRYQQ